MNLIILEEAEREFNGTINYYESREPGLGLRFRREAESVFNWIHRNADLARLRKNLYRRVNFPVFTHYVAYITRGDTVWIIAIAHAHRSPEFWLRRVLR